MMTADLKSSSFTVRALSLGGWWNFHSRKVPRATRNDLRPDGWRDIWPELVDADPAKPAPLALGVPAGGAISSEAKEAAHA